MVIEMYKGQFTIIGIIMVFVALIVFVGFLPALNTIIANGTAEADPVSALMLRLIPFLIVIAIIGSIFVYMRPQREAYQ